MIKTFERTSLLCLALTAACYSGVEQDQDEPFGLQSPETEEIVQNLRQAGFPRAEIEVLEDGTVFVGSDAVVTLEASREMAGLRRVPSELEDDDEFRQYRTNNLVSASVQTICIDGSAFTGTLSTALNNAIANYNNEALSFDMVRTNGSNAGCDAEITMVVTGGSGGSAGFPSGGLPYGQVDIGSGVSSLGVAVTTHVITHELGHCIGFRHTDYFNRSISCGAGGNEGDGGVGAVHIPGTPTGAVLNGSVMNSCFNGGSTGNWTDSDLVALADLYGGGADPGPDPDPDPGPSPTSCVDKCGQNAGQCWCDDQCESFGDCCADKAAVCDAPPEPSPTSCFDQCGGNAGQCWCDDQCASFGDCCADKVEFCG